MNERKQTALILGALLVFNVIGFAFLYRGSGNAPRSTPYYQEQQHQQQEEQKQQQQTAECKKEPGMLEDFRHEGKKLSYEIRYDDPTKWKEFKAFDSRAVEKQLTREEVAADGSKPYFETCLAKYKQLVDAGRNAEVQHSLLDWAMLEPVVLLNESCKAPPLPDPSKLDCKWPHDRAGFVKKREKPRKLGLAIQYGFEVDVLEMLLSEVYDVVDRIFICENMRSHQNKPKMLMWERLKTQPRFERYSDRIVHLILDDAEALPSNQAHKLFEEETNQERLRFHKVMEWNDHYKFFGPDDYIGFGDTDEIPSRNSLQYLRYCDADHNGPIDFGIWFTLVNIQHTWRSDWPVPGHPYTLGDPTFHRVSDLLAKHAAGDLSPTRNRGRSGHFILGGVHISTYPYAPAVLVKLASGTEYRDIGIPTEGLPIGEAIDKIDFIQFHDTHDLPTRAPDLRGKLGREEHYPWIFMCNPDRYKTWFNLRDPRLFLPKDKVPFTC